VGWKTLPRNYLEVQFDSLNLERSLEPGRSLLPDVVERLRDYPDAEEDTVCKASGEIVTSEDEVRRTPHLSVHCHACNRIVWPYWNKVSQVWKKPKHYLVSEGDAKAAPSETN